MPLIQSESNKIDLADVLICVHGYSPINLESHREQKEVLEERVECGLNVAEKFSTIYNKPVKIVIVFLGVGSSEIDKTNAQITMEYAQQNYSDRLNLYTYTKLDDRGGNTEEEAKSVCDRVGSSDVPFIVSVSNRDHSPRINRTWSKIRDDYDLSSTVLVTNSLTNYSKFESIGQSSNPFILEAASFEPIIRVLDENMWSVSEEDYEDLASDLDDVFSEYT